MAVKQFFRAWLVLALAFALVLLYEWVYPHSSFLKQFRSYIHGETLQELPIDENDATKRLMEQALALEQSDTLPYPLNQALPLSLRPKARVLLSDYDINSLFEEEYIPLSLDCLRLAAQEQLAYRGEQYLQYFFEALEALKLGKKKKLRIGYFGDSTTEGDLCVSFFRSALQSKYGGKGVGFVPINHSGMRFRQTIRQQADARWQKKEYLFKGGVFDYGIAGEYVTAPAVEQNSYSLNFQAGKGQGDFQQVYLFYGKGEENAHIELLVENAQGQVDSLKLPYTGELVNRVKLSNSPTSSLKLSFRFVGGQTPLFGLSFEGETGIYVDNIAKRGDSGSQFGRIKSSVLAKFRQYLDYDLIILQYGPNILSDRHLEYGFYETLLLRSVSHLKTVYKNTPILIVSNPDRGVRRGGEIQTSPAVYGLLKAQSRAALRSESAFFNLFDAMGGEGSMKRWVEEAPTKASSDYTHFNGRGGQEVARLLWDYLFAEEAQ